MNWEKLKATITFEDGSSVSAETEYESLSIRMIQELKGFLPGPLTHFEVTNAGRTAIISVGNLTDTDRLAAASRLLRVIGNAIESGDAAVRVFGSDWNDKRKIVKIETEGEKTAAPDESCDAPVNGRTTSSASPTASAGLRSSL